MRESPDRVSKTHRYRINKKASMPVRTYKLIAPGRESGSLTQSKGKREMPRAITTVAKGSDPNPHAAFEPNVRKDHPKSIPSGCMCTWTVTVNRIWLLKYESYICPFKGNH